MSEINCFGDEVVFNEVIPNWYLVQLVNISPDIKEKFIVGDFEMKEGDFGLTHINDPTFVFSLPPIAEPEDEDESESESESEDKDEDEAEDLYYQTLEHYQERLYGGIESCYNLVMSSIKAGYNFEEDGYLCYWLLNKIYESFRKGKTHTYLKSGGVIYYQPLNNDTPLYDLETQLKDKKEYNLINNNSKCYWLNKAINKKTNEIVYIEYSHWDEIKDTHYHVIWYKLNEIETKTGTKTDTETINKTYWNKFIRAVGSYELEYEIVE